MKLHDYQVEVAKRAVESDKLLLFIDMSLGKTAMILSAVDTLDHKVLVIAPLQVAKNVWDEEMEIWCPHLKISKIVGTVNQRLKALEAEADVYAINIDVIVWLVTLLNKKWDFDMVIMDELTMFKSSKSKCFRAMKRVLPYIKRRIGMTGTPTPKGLVDLWSQVYLVDGGERLGKSKTAYLDKYFTPYFNGTYIKYSIKPGARDTILSLIEDITISMKKEDYLPDLPKCAKTNIYFDLTDKAQYDEFKKEYVLELEGRDITAMNGRVLLGKLKQLTGGSVYDGRGGVERIHLDKIKALQALVKDSERVIVFYQFTHELTLMQEHFPNVSTINDKHVFKRWNNQQIPLLVLHPKSACHGLNLQHGGHTIVWYTLEWDLELYLQANARLHRQGQRELVNIYHLMANDTVDDLLLDILHRKKTVQDAVMEHFKIFCENP